MKMDDPKPTFTYFASQLKAWQPRLAYLHVVEPRVVGMYDRKDADIGIDEENDCIRSVWAPKPFISAGGYNRISAIDAAERRGDLIAFGRHFIANVRGLLPSRSKQVLKNHTFSLTWYTG